MGFRDILVHINISKHCPARLDLAARLAKTFDAHLTGLFTSSAADVPFFMMEEITSNMEPVMRAWWMQKCGKARAAFDDVTGKAGIATDWLDVDGDADAIVPCLARYGDLAVVGQIDRDELLPRPEYEVPERAVLESGGPVLVVPCAAAPSAVGQRILVAWNGSPQSARAAKDALPFLRQAEKVTILSIGKDEMPHNIGGGASKRIASHLTRCGVDTEAQNVAAEDTAAGDMILSHAVDMRADLIVMGAYGHARAREMILGGATRHLLQHTTVPVLMSH